MTGQTNDAFCKGWTTDAICIGRTNEAFIKVRQMTHFV